MRKFLIVFISLSVQISFAQNTVGLITHDAGASYSGYNLFFPHNQPDVFLIDNCGEIVNRWEGVPNTRPGNSAYVLKDGRLALAYRPADVGGDAIWAGGGGATIELRDWDNNTLWSYTLNNENARLHHDFSVIEKEGSTTILAIAWERKTGEEARTLGRTTPLESDEIWPDYVFEIDPETDEILWEWHAWDHLIQDVDDNLPDFGVIVDNPNRININYDFDGTGDPDWMHSNAIDYDPINRQVILTVPTFHELWIIDHTTTTEEAASSSGGFGKRGGDLLFRWGNPPAYNFSGQIQQLFYPHDGHIVDDFVEPGARGYRQLMVFNNRVDDTFSQAQLIAPTFSSYDWQFQFGAFGYAPQNFLETYEHPVDRTRMASDILSSAQYLPNDNVLICVGRFGYSFEVTSSGEIVWEYITPLASGQPVEQGELLEINQNLTFRMKRYPIDFEGFEGVDLSTEGTLETGESLASCNLILNIDSQAVKSNQFWYPNPVQDAIKLKRNWDELKIVDLNGRIVLESSHTYKDEVDISTLQNGLYLLQIIDKGEIHSYRLIKE